MNKLFSYLIIAVIAIMAISCADPEQPTPTNMAAGEWGGEDLYTNGQDPGSSASIDRLFLERNNTFLLEDANGILITGTWDATDTNLTLTEAGASPGDTTGTAGAVLNFEIVYQSYFKMQLRQTITNPTAGDFVITYLMDRIGDGTYYD